MLTVFTLTNLYQKFFEIIFVIQQIERMQNQRVISCCESTFEGNFSWKYGETVIFFFHNIDSVNFINTYIRERGAA